MTLHAARSAAPGAAERGHHVVAIDGAGVARIAHHRALLQDAQELDLEGQREIPDLVEKQGPAIGRLEGPQPRGDGAREGALLVAEELALGQGLGAGAAVDGHEGRAAAWAAGMNDARDLFLAGASLTKQQHRRVHARDRGGQSSGSRPLPVTPPDDPASQGYEPQIPLCRVAWHGCVSHGARYRVQARPTSLHATDDWRRAAAG